MEKNSNNSINLPKDPRCRDNSIENINFSSTEAIDRNVFMDDISTGQHAFLEIISPDEIRQKIKLDYAETTIGRIPDCRIQLPVENVSRRHATIIYSGEEYRIEDSGSKNGIYVNGIRVEKCILRKNDIIEIGGVKMLFIEEDSRLHNE